MAFAEKMVLAVFGVSRMHLWFLCQFRFRIAWVSLKRSMANSCRLSLSYGWPGAWRTTSLGGQSFSTAELGMEQSL